MPNNHLDVLNLLKSIEKTQWDKREFTIPDVPILAREDVQKLIVSRGAFETRSSGSTGIPVVIQRTELSQLWWLTSNIRELVWHKRDVRLPIAAIKATISKAVVSPSWGPVVDSIFGKSGNTYGHPVKGDLNTWLQSVNPAYIMTYPSIVETLDLTKLSNLKGIKTTGETLIHRRPLIVDTYSSEEVGTIAIQCPDNSDYYHVMEHLALEIVNDAGEPAEAGRVIVTDFTSPYLHRYDIGDQAELGECDCGRGLQTLRRILGRTRNMVVMPDGTKHWPRIGSLEFRTVAPIKRFQAIQVSKDELELRLIVEQNLTNEQEQALKSLVHKWIGSPFDVKIIYVERFPDGKFEEFICKVA